MNPVLLIKAQQQKRNQPKEQTSIPILTVSSEDEEPTIKSEDDDRKDDLEERSSSSSSNLNEEKSKPRTTFLSSINTTKPYEPTRSKRKSKSSAASSASVPRKIADNITDDEHELTKAMLEVNPELKGLTSNDLSYYLKQEPSIVVRHEIKIGSLLDNYMFWFDIIMILFCLTNIIMSMLLAMDSIIINNYIFLIVFSIIVALIIIAYSVLYFLKYKQHPEYSKVYFETLFSSFSLFAIVSIVFAIFLGQWINRYQTINDRGADKSNPIEYNQYVLVYSVNMVFYSIALCFFPATIFTHIYPTVQYQKRNDYIETREY